MRAPSFPRLISRGLIEASALSSTASAAPAFPRLISRGLIEAGGPAIFWAAEDDFRG